MNAAVIERCPRCRALLCLSDAVRRPDGSLLAICDSCIAIVPLQRRAAAGN